MLDLERHRTALLDFLRVVDSLAQPRRLAAEYLRYPSFDHSTLTGSPIGRNLWEQPAAQKLIATLLEDDDLGKWFSPPPDSAVNELRSHVASLVHAWGLREVSAEQVVADWADSFLQTIKNPAAASSRVRVLYGVEVQSRIDLASGVAVEPASTDGLRRFLSRSGGFEREVLRIPRMPAVFVLTAVQVKREEFGRFAAVTANAWTDVLAENARWDIWLATGVLPRLGDTYVTEYSPFPVIPSERHPASQRETHSRVIEGQALAIDPGLLVQIHERMRVLRGEHETFPDEAMMPLWIANTFIHPAIDAADALMTVLLAYAGCEGLLLRRDDDDSRFGPRLAILVGCDNEEERRLRRVAARWMELRGFAAHGQRPPIEAVAAFLEQELAAQDLAESILGVEKIRQASRQRASKLFRRVFLGMLFCAVAVDSQGSPQPSLLRDEVVDILEKAASGHDSARQEIAARVPQFVRDIGL